MPDVTPRDRVVVPHMHSTGSSFAHVLSTSPTTRTKGAGDPEWAVLFKLRLERLLKAHLDAAASISQSLGPFALELLDLSLETGHVVLTRRSAPRAP